jgi:hypothetical protein
MGTVAARAGFAPRALACPAAYRPRNPRASSLYPLLETHFETLKRLWEERFERRYGPRTTGKNKLWRSRSGG